MSEFSSSAQHGVQGSTRILSLSIGLVMLVALLMRLHDLGALPLWLDEAYSVWFASRDWTYLWAEVPQFETHPSFYYSLLKLWSVFGTDEFTVRLLSTLLNVATIPLVALAARCCGDRRTGPQAAVLAAILFACSATQLHASQDARPYALMTFGMAMALASTMVVMTAETRAQVPLRRMLAGDRRMVLAFAGIGAGIALLGWSHNFGPIVGLTLGACLFGFWLTQGRQRDLLVNLLFASAVAMLLYAPNLPIIMMQFQSLGNQGFWLGRPGIWQAFAEMREMPLGHSAFNGPRFGALGALSFMAALAGLLGLMSRDRRVPLAVPVTLLVMAAAPAMLSFIISRIGQPIFLFRTLQASQIPVVIALAYLPIAIQRHLPLRMKWAATLPPLVLAATALWSFHLNKGRPAREDYRTLVPVIAAEAARGTARLVVYPPELELPFRYYSDRLDRPVEIVSVPATYPARGPGYSYPAGGGGSPGMTPQMLSDLVQRLENDSRIWIATRNVHLYDPGDLMKKGLEQEFPCLIDDKVADLQLRARAAPDGTCQ